MRSVGHVSTVSLAFAALTPQGSCGIQVAALAGLPQDLLSAAQVHAQRLSHIMSVRKAAKGEKQAPPDTAITTGLSQVIQALRSTQRSLLQLVPMQYWQEPGSP